MTQGAKTEQERKGYTKQEVEEAVGLARARMFSVVGASINSEVFLHEGSNLLDSAGGAAARGGCGVSGAVVCIEKNVKHCIWDLTNIWVRVIFFAVRGSKPPFDRLPKRRLPCEPRGAKREGMTANATANRHNNP